MAPGARADRTAFETSGPSILPAVLARHKTLARVGRAIRARARQAQPTVARALGSALAALGLALGAGCTPSYRPLTIVVRCAPFPSVEAAAAAESLVQWTDADPTDDDACTESYAALELASWLRRCPGVGARPIALAGDGLLPTAGDAIVLGDLHGASLARDLLAGARPDTASRDAFRLRAVHRGGRTVWVVCGASRTGTLYGAYALLERLGVRFYGPADSESVLPRARVALPAKLDVASAPAFELRGFWAWEPRGNPAFFRWMARRRMNLWTAVEPGVPLLRKLGFRLAGGGHSLQADDLNPRALSDDGRRTNFEAHPEWYGLHAGRRSPNLTAESGDNFCTSNPAAVEALARHLVADLRGGRLRNADLVNVWTTDGGRWCECDACRALGTPSDRALDLTRRLAAAVAAARRRGELNREVVLSAAAYLETLAPPTRSVPASADDRTLLVTFFPYFRCYAHALADPSCTELNRRLESAWEGWSRAPNRAYAGPLGVCEYYNVSWFKSLPLVFPHVMARDIADDRAAGARLFCYMHAPTSRWGTWRLNHLVMSESLWSPVVNVDSLVTDYCARAFPHAAVEMTGFYRALEAASANIFAVEMAVGGVFAVPGVPAGRLAARAMRLLVMAHLPYEPVSRTANAAPAWTEIMAAMDAARDALDRARRAPLDPGEAERVADDAERFRYGELTFGLYDRLLRLALADRGEAGEDVAAMLAQADSLAAELRAIRELVQVAGAHADASDGLEASHVGPALEYFHARFGNGLRR